MRNIPFSPPDITELEIQEVCEALRSGWITTGPRTKQLEKELAEYCHVAKLVCLNSATAAEEMNLRVLGIGEGDEVLVPAYTYTATAAAAIHVGATVKFIDSQKDSLEMDYDQMERAITEKTKAVIPVDLGGIPCDYDRIYQAVEGKKALFCPKGDVQEALGRVAVVADCAHGLGASRHGVPTGALADFTSFSFHAVKNFTTAEGGASAWRTLPGLDDEEHPTQQVTYANRLPEDLSGRQCFLIDPMLATGGTLVAATHYLAERGAKDVTAINIIAAPEGIKYVEEHIDPSIDFKVVVCAVDERLNDKCYIVPGLGDAGDRLYGVID